jgi:serpin B
MKRTLSFWTLLLFLTAILITSCRPATPINEPAQDGSVSFVEQAGLDQTVAIEIAVLTTETAGESGAEAPGYVSLLTITDHGLVKQIVSALDVALELGPRARCPNGYELRFHLEDGAVQTFGYACGPGGPAFLRGGQGFWQGQQVTPPDEFNTIVQEQLASVSGREAVPVPDPVFARDAVLTYLARVYSAQAPSSALDWDEEITTPKQQVGSSSFQYSAADWVVTVTFPIVAPESTIYRVTATNQDSGFQWEGDADAWGQVREITRPKRQGLSPAQVTGSELADLVSGNNDFALDLYQVLRAKDGNLFYSPYSISLALAMTYAGARGETEQQMAQALGFVLPQNRLHRAFSHLTKELASRSEGASGKDENGFELNIANAVWGQEGYQFLADFLDILDANHGAGMRTLDFASDPEQARLTINAWASDETEGRIEDLVPPDAIDPLTRLVLTNAIYFNAAWNQPFSPEATANGPFHLLDGDQTTVSMMRQSEHFDYAAGDGYQAIQLPYDGYQTSMVILLPAQGEFGAFEGMLDAGVADSILQDLEPKQVSLSMPRFEYDSDFSLEETLAAMGMPDAFTSAADFSGMTGNRELFISEVIHKAFVSVDEEGTEAAAATAVMMPLSAAPEEPIVFTADRPFVFLIRDNLTGAILFVGRVVNPGS